MEAETRSIHERWGVNLTAPKFAHEDFEALRPLLRAERLDATYRDLVRTLTHATPAAIAFLRVTLVEGRLHGEVYLDRGCGCVKGTLALGMGLRPDAMAQDESATLAAISALVGTPLDSTLPVEALAFGISLGDTPADNPASALLVAMIDRYTHEQGTRVTNQVTGEDCDDR